MKNVKLFLRKFKSSDAKDVAPVDQDRDLTESDIGEEDDSKSESRAVEACLDDVMAATAEIEARLEARDYDALPVVCDDQQRALHDLSRMINGLSDPDMGDILGEESQAGSSLLIKLKACKAKASACAETLAAHRDACTQLHDLYLSVMEKNQADGTYSADGRWRRPDTLSSPRKSTKL
ncbi:hypothetical protein [Iodidimonas muriae]|uniref:hypothetical protein n=1 Tax=Iodidimonas muriae TaxID=261467 RepID=UPI0012309D5E|nr:hypothetical protein [Iodidimonas muriae]